MNFDSVDENSQNATQNPDIFNEESQENNQNEDSKMADLTQENEYQNTKVAEQLKIDTHNYMTDANVEKYQKLGYFISIFSELYLGII